MYVCMYVTYLFIFKYFYAGVTKPKRPAKQKKTVAEIQQPIVSGNVTIYNIGQVS